MSSVIHAGELPVEAQLGRYKVDAASGRASYGPEFHDLKGFHRVYSKALLRSAQSRLLRRLGPGPSG